MKNYMLISLSIILASCGNYEQVQKLKAENALLKKQIDSLITAKQNYEINALIIPKSGTIKLGEQYEAILTTSVINRQRPISAYIESNSGFKDTITYNKECSGIYFSETPSEIGFYNYSGAIYCPLNDKTYSFNATYEVIK